MIFLACDLDNFDILLKAGVPAKKAMEIIDSINRQFPDHHLQIRNIIKPPEKKG